MLLKIINFFYLQDHFNLQIVVSNHTGSNYSQKYGKKIKGQNRQYKTVIK